MSGSLQAYLARATQKAAADLLTALERLPQDKRDWQPMGDARSAADQVAECAILNGTTADLIAARAFPDFDFAQFAAAKTALVADPDTLRALLQANTARVIAALSTVDDAELEVEIPMPWGAQSLASILAYPYWNMSYHEGQINYIASMLGALP